MSEDVARLHAWVDANREDLLERFRGALRIPSTKAPPAGENAPYGEAVRRALDYTLDLSREMGFPRVKDVDGHAGHVELGGGDEMIAAFGHLDVVPAGEGWRHDPFGAEIEDGYVYSRGATDDKGGLFAALFGAKALLESGLPLRRRVRVIFGCDEESGFGCVKHYWEVAKEERPVFGFTPDAAFPLFYAEKHVVGIVLERDLPAHGGAMRVASMHAGTRLNIVPDRATARLEGDAADLYRAAVLLTSGWDRNVDVRLEEKAIVVTARGKAAHGAYPQGGDNAMVRLARALVPVVGPEDASWLTFVVWSSPPDGSGLGVSGADDVTGPLTCNAGILDSTPDGRLTVAYNLRVPVTWDGDDVIKRVGLAAERAGFSVARSSNSHGIHVALDREPARTLLRVYREETGDLVSKPQTMGGATYARATPNAICYGPIFPGARDGVAHQSDERIEIENFFRAVKLYARALYELANADGD